MSEKGIPLTGFKDCDVRGEFGTEVNAILAYRIGRAAGSRAEERKVVVGGDFRISTPELMKELIRGLTESGVAVYDLGQVSTPCYYFARRKLGIKTGIMVTASHSPSSCNGFKPVFGELPGPARRGEGWMRFAPCDFLCNHCLWIMRDPSSTGLQ